MRPAEIHKQLKTKPFVPIRLYLSDGSHYDVRHPEMIIVSHTVVSVAVVGKDDATLPESIVLCDPLHITRLVPINGRRKKSAKAPKK